MIRDLQYVKNTLTLSPWKSGKTIWTFKEDGTYYKVLNQGHNLGGGQWEVQSGIGDSPFLLWIDFRTYEVTSFSDTHITAWLGSHILELYR